MADVADLLGHRRPGGGPQFLSTVLPALGAGLDGRGGSGDRVGRLVDGGAGGRLHLEHLVLLLVGFGAIAVLDPIAARRGEAPLFFARLRPVQIPIALLSLAALLALRL